MISVVAKRYARSLFAFAQEKGTEDIVYSQVLLLLLRIEEFARLKETITKEEIEISKKTELLELAMGEKMVGELKEFILFVDSKHRMDMFLRILNAFLSVYREVKNLKVGRLVTAVPVQDLKKNLEVFLSDKTGKTVKLQEEVDPEILGGFVLEIDDQLLDASIERQIRKIRRELIEKNNRIV